jgi:hypothetical protein
MAGLVLGLLFGGLLPSQDILAQEFLELPRAHEGEEAMERLRVARRAEARDIDFYSPFYSIEGQRDTTLFVMNRISEPIAVELVARSQDEELALGSYTIESLRHVELSLREILAGMPPGFRAGSLRMSLLGDEETVQAWAVIQESTGQTFEVPFTTPDTVSATLFYAFWNLPSLGPSQPGPLALHLLNTSKRELSVTLGTGKGRQPLQNLRLQPGERVRWSNAKSAAHGGTGWVEVSHDGEAGDLIGVGTIGDEVLLGTVALIPRGEAETRRHYESLPFPLEGTGDTLSSKSAGWLSILSVARDQQEVTVELLDAASGTELARTTVRSDPFEVVTMPMGRLTGGLHPETRNVRIRVKGQTRGLCVQGTRVLQDHTTEELAFSAAYEAHGSAKYPLPDIRRYETVTTIINAGHEPSEVVGQVYWDGGTFALGPLTIPAGASHDIQLEVLAESAPMDLLGRTLDPFRPGGVLQLAVSSGSRHLLGRTFVRPRKGQDRFGFNCFGCCHQWPRGAVVPNSATFNPGQSEPFQIAYYEDTCSGTIGPYPTGATSMTVPSPFTWNGSYVGATAPAKNFLSFQGLRTKITSGCQEYEVNINGFGTADSCKGNLAKPGGGSWDPAKTCISQASSCAPCYNCCDAILAYNLCKGANKDLAQSEANTCKGHCLTDRC